MFHGLYIKDIGSIKTSNNMSRTIRLKSILKEVLNEIGDIQNIKPYPFSKTSNQLYEFETEDGELVQVSFLIAPISLIGIEDTKEKTFTNIGFTISGSETQLKKSKYSYLIKILKTVVEVIIDYLKINHPKYLFISSTNKTDEKSMIIWDSQKTKLYQAIMIKNINKLPKYGGEWKYKILDNALNIEGESILLYNEN